MYQIKQITSDSLQQQTLVLPDGTQIGLTMYYRPLQYGWFINEITFGSTFTLQGLRITVSPNMLHQFRNQIPFGLACVTATKREPTQITDFSSGAFQLYVLSAAEVAEYASYLQGGAA